MLQLLHMMDDWMLCLEKGQIDAIYSDFEKAFDKVPHKRLISKLHSYNIGEGIIKWIVDFLNTLHLGIAKILLYIDGNKISVT